MQCKLASAGPAPCSQSMPATCLASRRYRMCTIGACTLQVQKVGKDVLHGFWSKWYFPANATLYMVGDFENGMAGGIPAVEDLIRKTFGSHRLQPGRQSNGAGPSSGPLKQRHEVRTTHVSKKLQGTGWCLWSLYCASASKALHLAWLSDCFHMRGAKLSSADSTAAAS